ncbi:MAG: LysM repeat protein [Bradymonadia bacterium]|jgi:LysM repeat protein
MRWTALAIWIGLLGIATPAGAVTYTIRSGDSLNRIGKACGCDEATLKTANNMSSNALRAGAKLNLPRACRLRWTCIKGPKARRSKARKGKKATKGKKTRRRGKPKLREVLADYGFNGRRHFKARVIEFKLTKNNKGIAYQHEFDWDQTADDNTDWNAASTVKLFSAIAAAERIKAKGFDSRAKVTFFDRAHTETTVQALLEASLIKSDNIAHNRLAQLAGYDWMNGRTLKGQEMHKSAVHRPYETSRWIPMTGARTFKSSPKIVLRRGKKTRTLPARTSKGTYTCKHSAACSSMADLARGMARLMLAEQLPKSKTFNIHRRDRKLIIDALKAKRKRGMDVVNNIAKAFGNDELVMYHKPGFSEGWISDVVYIYRRRSRKRWIVAIAGYPGRAALNRAALAIGEALAADALAY